MRIALAQIDTRVGDLEGNVRRILLAVSAAREGGAAVAVLPELAVTGYPPRDLLHDPAFQEDAFAAARRVARETAAGPAVVLGTIARSETRLPGHPGLENSAVLLEGGEVRAVRSKRLLPAYDVFHEPRWFTPGKPGGPVEVAGRRAGLLVCEDLWDEGYPEHPPADLLAQGAEFLIAISSSPYRVGILERRLHHARRPGVPVVYLNAVGANDELIFDGGSFVVDRRGAVTALLPRFEEAVEIVDLDRPAAIELPSPSLEEERFRALALGVRDFVRKNGLRRAFLGLSGGVDSALVACIAREALGPKAVTAVAMPSRHTDPRSTRSAEELASTLGIGFEVVNLEPLHQAAEKSLGHLLEDAAGGTASENIQARLRALVLLAHVNRRGGLLLNTSNKTELALGYGTLHGDLAGTLGVIADLTKPEVYALSRWYDGGRGVIPSFILNRPPTAELFPDQVDPFDYPRISPLVEALIQGSSPPEATEGELEPWRRRILAAEHKRWQYGITLKLTEKSFGTGRMMPVTRR